jgi:PRTRC genetic system protein A
MNNLVTYYLHRANPLPPSDALFYQYVIAQNGVFVRAENDFASACIRVARLTDETSPLRGLQPLDGWVRLKIPRIPLALLEAAIADAQAATAAGHLVETLNYITWGDGRYRLVKPGDQQANPSAVTSEAVELGQPIVMDLHSHGTMAPFFSAADNRDETRFRFYGVLGRLPVAPTWRFRLGIYGHWLEIDRNVLFD